MFEKVMAIAWIYPVWNAVFGLLLVFLVAKYQKLNQVFVMQKIKKLAGKEAVEIEHLVQRVMYVVMFLAGWWIYFFAVIYKYAFIVSVSYNDMLYKTLQCLNFVASLLAGGYRLIAVELKKPPYKGVYRLRFWIVQIGMLLVWGITGILLFVLR